MKKESGNDGLGRRDALKAGAMAAGGLAIGSVGSRKAEAQTGDERLTLGPEWTLDDKTDGSLQLVNQDSGATLEYDENAGEWSVGSLSTGSVDTDRAAYAEHLLPDRGTNNPLPIPSHSEIAVPTGVEYATNIDNPVLTPSDFDSLHSETVAFIADPRLRVYNGKYLCYVETKTSSYKHIDYATSVDGVSWSVGTVLDGATGEGYSGPYHFKEFGNDYLLPTQDDDRDLHIYKADSMPDSFTEVRTVAFSESIIDPTPVRFDPDARANADGYLYLFFKDDNITDPTNRSTVVYRSQNKGATLEDATWVETTDSPLSTDWTESVCGRPLVGPKHIALPQSNGKNIGWVTLSNITADTWTESDTANVRNKPVLANTSDGRWTDTGIHSFSYVPSGPNGESLIAIDGNAGAQDWTVGFVTPAPNRPVLAKAGPAANQAVSSGTLGGSNEVNLAVGSADKDFGSQTSWATSPVDRFITPSQGRYKNNVQIRIGNITGTAPFEVRMKLARLSEDDSTVEVQAQKTVNVEDTDNQTLPELSGTIDAYETGGDFRVLVSQNSGASLDIISGAETMWTVQL